MTTAAARPSALQMALLWENRLSKDVGPSLQNLIPLSPTPLTPPPSPHSDDHFFYPSTPRRPRRKVSASKPPVAPILAPNPITANVQEVTLPHRMLDASSPVSSFHSSAPSSPPVLNPPRRITPPRHGFLAQLEQLQRDLAHCHQRMDTLETRFRVISAGMRNVRVYNIR